MWHKTLTVDGEFHWIAGVITEIIEHMTDERPLVVTCHFNYSENGASIIELNSVAECNLRAVVQPDKRREGSRGGAGQTDRAVELWQVCAVGSYHNIGDMRYG